MDLANKLPKIKDQERESKFGYVFAVSGPGKKDQTSPVNLICISIPQLFLSSIYISCWIEYIGLLLLCAVVTAENMSGAAMYELVSVNLSERNKHLFIPILVRSSPFHWTYVLC